MTGGMQAEGAPGQQVERQAAGGRRQAEAGAAEAAAAAHPAVSGGVEQLPGDLLLAVLKVGQADLHDLARGVCGRGAGDPGSAAASGAGTSLARRLRSRAAAAAAAAPPAAEHRPAASDHAPSESIAVRSSKHGRAAGLPGHSRVMAAAEVGGRACPGALWLQSSKDPSCFARKCGASPGAGLRPSKQLLATRSRGAPPRRARPLAHPTSAPSG